MNSKIDWKFIRNVAQEKATDEEKSIVDQWRDKSEEHLLFQQEVTDFYKSQYEFEPLTENEIDQRWKVFSNSNIRKRSYFYRYIAAASIILIAVSASLFVPRPIEDQSLAHQISDKNNPHLILTNGQVVDLKEASKEDLAKVGLKLDTLSKAIAAVGSPEQKIEMREVIVPACSSIRLQLPDSSVVVINAKSQFRFPSKFTGTQRRVELIGEAYFEITHDAANPFVVETADLSVKVLGTEFNLKAYSNADVCATLVKGSVEASHKGAAPVLLTPGQECRFIQESKLLSVNEADMVSALSWKNNEFIFKNSTLESIMEELSEWYDVEISVESDQLKSHRFYMYLDRGKDIKEVLQAMNEIQKFKYEINGSKVKIMN